MQSMCEVAWKKVLLNQFHDVLPGSSIGMVYTDAHDLYDQTLCLCSTVQEKCITALFQEGSKPQNNSNDIYVLNTLSWVVECVVQLQCNSNDVQNAKRQRNALPDCMQHCILGGYYVAIRAPQMGLSCVQPFHPPSVTLTKHNDGSMTIANQHLQATINSCGIIMELITKKNHKNVFDAGEGKVGNIICMYDDVPLFWDAWDVMDYHLETRRPLNYNDGNEDDVITQPLQVVESGHLYVGLQWGMQLSHKSHLLQEIQLNATNEFVAFNTKLEWNESHKLLKAEFDSVIHSATASYDIQFGYVTRPNHRNTSWDAAKFEVCGHKWANVSEFGLGMAVLSDSKYGWSCIGGRLCLSLLRAPKAPDDNCDIGTHKFSYAPMPHQGCLQSAHVEEKSFQFNSPVKIIDDDRMLKPDVSNSLLELKGEGVVLDTIKVAEGNPASAIVARLYEMHGGRSTISLCIPALLPVTAVEECNGLEEPLGKVFQCNEKDGSFNTFDIEFTPFQIKNVKITF